MEAKFHVSHINRQMPPSSGEISFGIKNVSWRKGDMTRTIDMQIGKIKKVTFMEYPGRDYCLEFHITDGYRHKFGGFEQEHVTVLEAYFKSHKISFSQPEVYVGGQNWGKLDLTDHHLSLVHGQKQSPMQLSLDDVSRVKKEKRLLKLKFHKDGNIAKTIDSPKELVFAFAGMEKAHEFTKKRMRSLRNLVEKEKKLKKPIAEFDNVHIATLRSEYDMRLYLKNLKLLGPEVKRKVMYKDITSVFVLPRNELSYVVVLCLDPPLYTYHGSEHHQTQHPFLTLEGDAVGEDLVSCLEVCIHKKAIRHSNYRSQDGSYAVDCSFLSKEGHLYPLDKGFLCLTTDPIYVPYEDIKEVYFMRGKEGHIKIRIALKTRQSLLFCDIKRDECDRLSDTMMQSGLRIKEPQEKTKMSKGKDVTESSQSERPSVGFCEEAQKLLEEEGLPIEFGKLQKRAARDWDNLPEQLKSYYRNKDAKRSRS